MVRSFFTLYTLADDLVPGRLWDGYRCVPLKGQRLPKSHRLVEGTGSFGDLWPASSGGAEELVVTGKTRCESLVGCGFVFLRIPFIRVPSPREGKLRAESRA